MSKAQILDELQEENANWEALLAEIGEARMSEPGVTDDWSMKDIVAHLTGWRKLTVARLQAALQNAPVPSAAWPAHLETVDEVNAWIYETNRERSAPDVLNDYREVFQQLFDAIQAFPESELMEPNRFDWLEGEPLSGSLFFGHFHDEHEADIRAWLAKRA